MSRTNEFEGTVEDRSESAGLLWIRTGPLRIAAPAWPGVSRGDACRWTVDPSEIILATGAAPRVTARNVFEGRVRCVTRTRYGVFVHSRVGVTLTAKVTPSAVRDLDLRPGRRVTVLFKAWSVDRLTAGAPAVRFVPELRVVGPHGSFGRDEIELLVQIDRTGSISEAARRIGISYRTAWLRVDSVRSSLGMEVLVTRPGGRGGGGSSLTAPARRLVKAFHSETRAIDPLCQASPEGRRGKAKAAGPPAGDPRDLKEPT